MRIGVTTFAAVTIASLHGFAQAGPPEDLRLTDWFEIVLKEAEAVLADRNSHPFLFNWEVVQSGSEAVARISGDFSGFEWPQKQMDLSSKNRWFERPHRIQRVADGWLAGYNGGEFGAELWWFSTNGEQSYLISNHQVNQFLATSDAVYAAEGLSHLTMSEGSVIRLSKMEGKWKAETFAKPEIGEPSAFVQVDDGSFIAFGSFGLRCWIISPQAVIGTHGALSKVAMPPYFSTAAREGSVIYIGSEYFVMAIDLRTLERRYLLPSEEHWKKIKDSYKPLFGD